jgi:signal transduction histidine kinase
LRHIEDVVEQDQRELREIVRELRPDDSRDGRAIIASELQRMRDRFSLEWNLEVHIDLPPAVAPPAPVAHNICRIVNESLSNAARHGHASEASVALTMEADGIGVRIADNGRGFPFMGCHDLEELDAAADGPRSLKERVRHLGGTLLIDSSIRGAVIDVHLPLADQRA